MSFDIIIPVTERNLNTLELVVAQLRKCIKCKSIIVIGQEKLRVYAKELGVTFMDEDSVFDNMTLSRIKSLIASRDKIALKRAGWYFQQFLKLAYAFKCKDEYYLSWDADTILLKEIGMFDIDGHPIFDIKDEYHKPYFSTMNKLFKGEVKREFDYSFISEHMIFSVQLVLKMLEEIESNEYLDGTVFYERILNAVNTIDLLESGFSEFETYGNYVTRFFPDYYRLRQLKSERNGDKVFGYFDTSHIDIDLLAQKYDIVTFENRDNREKV